MSLRSIHAVKVVKRKCPKRGKGRKGRKLDRQSVIEMFNDYLGGVHVVELAHKYLISEESVKERLRDFSVMRDMVLGKHDMDRLEEKRDELPSGGAKVDNGESSSLTQAAGADITHTAQPQVRDEPTAKKIIPKVPNISEIELKETLQPASNPVVQVIPYTGQPEETNGDLQLTPNISEVAMSVRGMGAKETFSPVTLIYYAYLKQKMVDDSATPEEKEIYSQIGFGEMVDMVFKIYCKEHGYELMMNVAGTTKRVNIWWSTR